MTAVNSGLSAGERVVVDGTDRLRDGLHVTIANESGPPAAPGGAQGKAAGQSQGANPAANQGENPAPRQNAPPPGGQ
jgi:multidrug efflux system membrane fusion protein